jgi:LysR family hydrogen peroxide-inducible transcriptional activator
MITLRQLRYLAALARHRHFGRAADDCAVTQPALSMQIREFERELGIELIERRPGDIALTDTGMEVAARAEHILASVRDLVDFARHRAPLSGSLKLGIIPTLAPYLLPRILPPLQSRYPALTLEIRESQTATLMSELVAGHLDAAMLALPVEGADLETRPLFHDPFLLAVPAGERLRGPVVPDDVDRHRLLLLEEGHCLRDQALAFCGMARRDLPAGLAATSLATVMQMVANGFGVTLVPQIAADAELRDDRVRALRFAPPVPGRTIGLAWRKTSPRRADFEAFGALVRDVVVPVTPAARPAAAEHVVSVPPRRDALERRQPSW